MHLLDVYTDDQFPEIATKQSFAMDTYLYFPPSTESIFGMISTSCMELH